MLFLLPHLNDVFLQWRLSIENRWGGYAISTRGPFPGALVGTIEGAFTPRRRVVESKEPDYMLSISLGERNWEPP